MSDELFFGLKVANYKCFHDQPEGFEKLSRFNLIVGRNNSGKSALLEAVEVACNERPQFLSRFPNVNRTPEILLGREITDEIARSAFPSGHSDYDIGGELWSTAGIHLPESRMWWSLTNMREDNYWSLTQGSTQNANRLMGKDQTGRQRIFSRLTNAMPSPFRHKVCRRINADRQIYPENSSSEISVLPTGTGVINAIHSFVNKAKYDRGIVQKELLRELNKIFGPDGHFSEITCKELQDGRWEVFLTEAGKGDVPLSASGTGLKTVIFVLVELMLVPLIMGKSLNQIVFCFEELENNLHPAILRRLLDHIYNTIIVANSMCFISTHSSTSIDVFGTREHSQLLHVSHDNQRSMCRQVKSLCELRPVLDELDVRASDILQANCVIWVEGPSDRTYLHKLIDIMSDGILRERFHYQFMFYGGKLLSHYSTGDAEFVAGLEMLRINRHSFLVVDADIEEAGQEIRATKIRVKSEYEAAGCGVWVTEGREIENYLPAFAIEAYLNADANKPRVSIDNDIGQFQKFNVYGDKLRDRFGETYKHNKAGVSIEIAKHLTDDPRLWERLDLESRVRQLCEFIIKSNKIPEDECVFMREGRAGD